MINEKFDYTSKDQKPMPNRSVCCANDTKNGNNNAHTQIQGGTNAIPISIRGRPASVDVDPQNAILSDVQQIIGTNSTGQTITHRKISNQSK